MEELEQAMQEIVAAESPEELREIQVKWLGRQGVITRKLKGLGRLPKERRKAEGMRLNALREALQGEIEKRAQALERHRMEKALLADTMDLTLPGIRPGIGHLHPVTLVMDEVVDLFERMGFHVLDYPEAEDDFHNFEGLNIPKDHPARDMQDTFYLQDGNLLRTHTSAGQIRAMKEIEPPFRAIFPGRVYRFEATDASHEHTFHQVEGLAIDRVVSVGHLLSAMTTLLGGIFARTVDVRLRPGYFPFVEPGFELDIRCMVCGGSGCSVCKRSGWVELLPCGLVHPNVLTAGGLDPEQWQGWAFGLGLSRLAMMRYGVDDIRWLMSGDLRFLRQF